MLLFDEIIAAEKRIRPFVRETYLEQSFEFGRLIDGEVYFKLENLQLTGSFKYRGATNRIRAAPTEELNAGFVTASTGNHGAAFAKAAQLAGASGIVFVPDNASPAKLSNMAQYGADIRAHGNDGLITETYARRYATEQGMTFVSPYNDPLVAAGQGTIGVELVQQMPVPADVVFVALGGGGLIGGIATYLKSAWPAVQLIGCSPENSKQMIDSVKAGEIFDLPSYPTLSDGTAGGVEPGSITFPLVRDLVDEFETATEEEIGAAMRHYMAHSHQMIEGAAGVAVASLIKRQRNLKGARSVVIICGGNIALETLKEVL
ncbi:MAG: threonine/serine dehydratase [Chloroflexota bacterium]